MTVVNQSQFAAMQGMSVGYVTKLKQQGRLVLTREGKVDVEASVRRIKETEDPNRSDVRARWRERRSIATDSGITADLSPDQSETPAPDLGADALSYQDARAMKERFLALQAKADYERSIAELVPAADIRIAGLNLGTLLRTSLEGLPDRLSAELAALSEPEAIRARLVEHVEDLLRQITEGLQKL
jgi:hypothetical protein